MNYKDGMTGEEIDKIRTSYKENDLINYFDKIEKGIDCDIGIELYDYIESIQTTIVRYLQYKIRKLIIVKTCLDNNIGNEQLLTQDFCQIQYDIMNLMNIELYKYHFDSMDICDIDYTNFLIESLLKRISENINFEGVDKNEIKKILSTKKYEEKYKDLLTLTPTKVFYSFDSDSMIFLIRHKKNIIRGNYKDFGDKLSSILQYYDQSNLYDIIYLAKLTFMNLIMLICKLGELFSILGDNGVLRGALDHNLCKNRLLIKKIDTEKILMESLHEMNKYFVIGPVDKCLKYLSNKEPEYISSIDCTRDIVRDIYGEEFVERI